MRLLFIQHAFSGPFLPLAARLGAVSDNTVLFVAERGKRERRVPGVRRLVLGKTDAARDACGADAQSRAEREMNQALRRGAETANALIRLRRDGFVPDVVCVAPNKGHSFYVRDVFPRAFYVAHVDWYYTRGENFTFFNRGRPRPATDFAPARARNLMQSNALLECHLALTSTLWQKAQFPAVLAANMHVVHEGVPTGFFSPAPGTRFATEACDLSEVEELVTFSGRGTEPFRGFPQFFRCLPRLLAARPRCHVLIMASGLDGERLAALRADLPDPSALDDGRVHVLGFCPREDYRRLLRASAVHVYLTAPYALSAGLFEAMSCGCLVVGSDTAPVREVVRHGHNGFLCDFWDGDGLADAVAGVLERAPGLDHVRRAARETILDNYDEGRTTDHALRLLMNSYDAWRATGR